MLPRSRGDPAAFGLIEEATALDLLAHSLRLDLTHRLAAEPGRSLNPICKAIVGGQDCPHYLFDFRASFAGGCLRHALRRPAVRLKTNGSRLELFAVLRRPQPRLF